MRATSFPMLPNPTTASVLPRRFEPRPAEDLHIDPAELGTVIAIASGTVMPNSRIALFAALERCPATPSRPLAPVTSNFFGTMLL